jgi:hypothetical protein
VVETPDQSEQVLRSDFVGCVVVAKDKFLNMTGRSSIPINSGVWLKGERGELGSRPSLFTDAKCADPSASPPESEACKRYSLFQITGNNISVTGLHLRGPAMGSRRGDQPYVHAIEVTADPDAKQGRGIYVGESEFDEWSGAGVEIKSTRVARTPDQYLPEWARLTKEDAGLIQVERNFYHHNARGNGGYGVSVDRGAFATIMGNVFDFNRHAVTSDGFAHTGYIARFNYVLEGGFKQDSYYNQHFDVHGTNDTNGDDRSAGYGGTAGENFEIAFNAIRPHRRLLLVRQANDRAICSRPADQFSHTFSLSGTSNSRLSADPGPCVADLTSSNSSRIGETERGAARGGHQQHHPMAARLNH